ncbi:MAG: hypothetical protein ACPLWB_06390 [Caldisericia bacterium]
MIKEDVKHLIKIALKDTFSEKINKMVEFDNESYLIYTDSALILVKNNSTINGMSNHFRFFSSYHFGDRCVFIERELIKKFIKKFDSLKKKRPIKASVIFTGEKNEMYIVSPSFILDFKEKFGTIGKSEDGEIIIFVPTVLLPKLKGDEMNDEEIRARRMIQIIDDINSIPFDDMNTYDDKDDINLSLTPNLYLDTSNDEKNEYFLKKLLELEREIKKLKENRKKRRKKNGN